MDVIANSKFTFLVICSEYSLPHQDNIIELFFFLQTSTIQGCHYYYKLRFSCTYRNKRFFVDVEKKHDILSIGGLAGVENFFSFSCSFF